MSGNRERLLERIVVPATEPLALSDVKNYLRVEHSDDDTHIDALIAGARQAAESHMQRSLITQSWLLAYNDYPPAQPRLPYGPVQSVTTVTLVAEGGSSNVLDGEHYHIDAAKRHLVFEATPLSHRVEIRYVSGFGDAASNVPAAIRQGLLLHVEALYEQRDSAPPIPVPALALYAPYREVRL